MAILAIDQGTTSSRACVFDAQFNPLSMAAEDFEQHFPHSGWVEHDPEEIWSSVLNCCKNAVQKALLRFSDIDTIGITNQRETTVVWDRVTGKAIYPAIVWQDRRTSDFCRELRAHTNLHELQSKTGLLLDPYFSASKIHWILHSVPDAFAKAQAGELAFGTIECFLLWRLTGGKVHATDFTNAARTLLLNLNTLCWDDELLNLFEIPTVMMPKINNNADDFGTTDPKIFDAEIPIRAMIGDQQSALVGQACLQPGMIKSTYGTGCFMVMNTQERLVLSKHQLLSTIGYRVDALAYAQEGSIFSAGVIIKWMRDQLHLFNNASDTEAMARSVADTQGVVMVPAFTGLGAPHWDPDARAAIFGISRGTTSAHLVRSGLEAIVYQSKDLLNAMHADGAFFPTEIRVDGGMVANNWMLQFLADMLNVAVVRPKNLETTGLGAAFLAAVGLGTIKLEQIPDYWVQDVRFEPEFSDSKRDRHYERWQEALERTLTKRS